MDLELSNGILKVRQYNTIFPVLWFSYLTFCHFITGTLSHICFQVAKSSLCLTFKITSLILDPSIYELLRSSQILSYFLEQISYLLDFYSNIERYMLIGDFNCDPSDPCLDNFMRENNLYCHIKVNTCFKSREGSRIDLILSNQKHGYKRQVL